MNDMRFKTGHAFYAYGLFVAALALPPAFVFRDRLVGVMFYLALLPALQIMKVARFTEVLGWQSLAASILFCLLALLNSHFILGYEAAIEAGILAFLLFLLFMVIRGVWIDLRRGDL